MKLPPHTPVDRAKQFLAIGLAALLTGASAYGQTDSDSVRRLQEENAALRKRLAALEGQVQPAAPSAQAPAPAAKATVAPAKTDMVPEAGNKDIVVLSPFVVREDKDFGYLKTNSATATRIGTEIQKVPLSISVISEEFLKDTGMKDIQDVLRYQGSSAGDTKMGILQPGTSFTPSGQFTTRGFPINSRLRNGLLRYNAYSFDNIERVEVIKGPAAVFFGGAFPGGVINYVTKQPQFSKIPTTLTYSYGGYDTRMGSERATIDHNQMLSDKAAIRFVGAWDHGSGDERYEYQNGFSFNAGLTLIPLKSGKLRIFVEGEKLARQRNLDDFSWVLPDQYFKDYQTPPAALIAAAGLSGNADPVAAYRTRILNSSANWIADVRNAAGNQNIPLYLNSQGMQHGAYITDKSGKRYLDEKFNYYGMGSFQDEEVSNFGITTDLAAFDWLDVRHSLTTYQTRYNRIYSAALPLADGVRFNQIGQVGATMQGYDQDAFYHQLDLVLKKKFAGIDNKLLVGGLYGKSYASFTASGSASNVWPYYGNLPSNFDKPDEGYVSPTNPAIRTPASNAGVNFAAEYMRDRNGKIITPQEIFSLYDPGVHVSPDIRRIAIVDRAVVDHSRPTRKEWYVNWQGTTLQDRLTTFIGYRRESQSTLGVGQIVAANPPWFTVSDNALANIPQADWPVYGLSAVFSRPRETIGTSKMAGFSFEVVKNVNVYASYSQTFLPPGVQYLGGDTNPDDIKARATLLGKDPATEYARVLKDGFFQENVNETGKNMEFGVKVALNDNKIVGTLSVFRVSRLNRTIDDTTRQVNEPLNYLANGTFNRALRWFNNSAQQQTEGVEFETIWSPTRNYQAVVSGSWMWEAKTVKDPSLEPNTTSSALAQEQARIVKALVLSNRLPYAPEYRFNIWNKYTFDHNLIGEHGRGLSLGLGARYASEIIIANSLDFNSQKGGLTAGDYVVFQSSISYPFEVLGYKMSGSLNVDNLTDKNYSEGGLNLSPRRSYTFTLGMKF